MIEPSQYSTAVWLLEINLQGQPFRWASEPVSVVDADGVSRRYDGGLDIDVELAYELLGDSPDLLQVPVELYWPVSVADLVARGYDLSAATGELSLWAKDTTYESRQIFLTASVHAPEYGRDDEPISFSLRQTPIDETSTVLDPADALTVTSTSVLDPGADGRQVPLVFGAPGRGETPGSPMIMGYDVGLAVSFVSQQPSAAGSIISYNITQSTTYTVTAETLSGRLFADLSGETPIPVSGDELWACFSLPLGIGDPLETGQPLTGAGSLLLYLCQKLSTPLDRQAFVDAAPYLNAYKVDGYIDTEVEAWSWMQENLLPILPISMAYGARGLYPIVWRSTATTSDAVCTLTDGLTCNTEGPIKYESKQIINECTVKYFMRADTQQYLKRVTVGATLDEADGTQAIAAASRARYGRRQSVLETSIVYDTGTAYRIASDRIRLNGLRRRSVSVSVRWDYAFLKRGDVVRFVSADYYLDTVAWVQSIAYTVTGIRLTLTIIDDPQRVVRPYG